MILHFFRHGPTPGNLEKRYVGRTDEEVLTQWLMECPPERLKKVDALYVSPMKRCIQTAKALYPGLEPKVVNELREMDFGDFEMKNYKELTGNADYQAWIDGGGMGAFPKGEDRASFQNRCVKGFLQALEEMIAKDVKEAAFVVHGGTIMAIMDQFSSPHEDYFHWGIKNGHCLSVTMNEEDYKRGKPELQVVE